MKCYLSGYIFHTVILCSIFFLSSWHYDPHYSMNAIVFFSIVLYYTVVLNLHTLYNYLYLLKNFILHLSVSKNPEIHIMLYTHILKGERWFSVKFVIKSENWKTRFQFLMKFGFLDAFKISNLRNVTRHHCSNKPCLIHSCVLKFPFSQYQKKIVAKN